METNTVKDGLLELLESPKTVTALAFAQALGSRDTSLILEGYGIDLDTTPIVRIRDTTGSQGMVQPKDLNLLSRVALFLEEVAETLHEISVEGLRDPDTDEPA